MGVGGGTHASFGSTGGRRVGRASARVMATAERAAIRSERRAATNSAYHDPQAASDRLARSARLGERPSPSPSPPLRSLSCLSLARVMDRVRACWLLGSAPTATH